MSTTYRRAPPRAMPRRPRLLRWAGPWAWVGLVLVPSACGPRALTAWVDAAPDTTPVGSSRLRATRPRVPVGWGAVVVDGIRDEPAWDRAGAAPPLRPLITGPTPPALDLSVVARPDALALGLSLPPGQRLTAVWDPDGTAGAWWVVTVQGETVRASWCGPVEAPDDTSRTYPSRARRCVPTPVSHGVADEVELVLPGRGRATRTGRLLVTVSDGSGGGGTWAPWGKGGALPELAAPLAAGPAVGRVRGGPADPSSPATVQLTAQAPGGPWQAVWRRHGVPVHRVAARRLGDDGRLEVPAPPQGAEGGAAVVLRPEAWEAPTGGVPWPPAVVGWLRRPPPAVWTDAPVVGAGEPVRLWVERAEAGEVPVRLEGPGRLAQTRVVLPAGRSLITLLHPGRPGLLRIVVGEGLDGVVEVVVLSDG